MKSVCFGDSEIAGALITDVPRLYHACLTALWRGEDFEQHAVSGYVVPAMADRVYAHSPAAGERFEIQIGTNDLLAHGAGAAAVEVFSSSVSALALWLAGNKSVATGWSFTGSWSTTGTTPGKYTTSAGATASGSFTGDVLLLGYTISDLVSSMGRFTLSVDGVNQGTFSCAAGSSTARNIDTNSYAPALIRLAGFGAGAHTFLITALDAGKIVFVDWVSSGSNGLLCSILSIPKATAAAYAAGGANYSSANTRVLILTR